MVFPDEGAILEFDVNLFIGHSNELWISKCDVPNIGELIEVEYTMTPEVMALFVVGFGSSLISARARVHFRGTLCKRSNDVPFIPIIECRAIS